MALLEVSGLTRHFSLRRNPLPRLLGGRRDSVIKAVENVSFTVDEGEIVGIVGESGCGKSTTCNLIARLDRPSAGRIVFRGEDVATLDGQALRRFRADVQMVFQDPFDSLNPRFRVVDLVAEAPRALHLWSEAQTLQRVETTLALVGLDPQRFLTRYPHEMSGGERQRVGIASALIVEPRLVIADEPVSMLDVSIRASILDLLRDLSQRLGFSCIYVSHDLSILSHICQRVMVMYLGQVMETARAVDLIERPQHPYSQALVAAVPVPDPNYRRPPIPIKGELATPVDPPEGCRFAPRCPHAMEICRRETPPAKPSGEGHFTACHWTHLEAAA